MTFPLTHMFRIDGVRHGEDILSLHNEVHRLSLEQTVLSDGLKRRHDTTVASSQQRDNEIINMLQDLRHMVIHGDVEARHCQETLAAATSDLATVQAGVITSLARQNDILSSSQKLEEGLRAHSQETGSKLTSVATGLTALNQSIEVLTTKTDLATDNADVLGRLVRAELRQQFEPLFSQVHGLREQVDRIALTFSAKAHNQAVFQMTGSVPDIRDLSDVHEKSVSADALEKKKIDVIASMTSSTTTAGKASQEVRLLSTIRNMKTILGCFKVRLDTYRLRNLDANSQTKFFRLQVDFVPRRWLPCGFSALYATGPDSLGYYSICPTIQTFRIIPETDHVWDLFDSDDVDGVRRMIEGGQLRLRDKDHMLGKSLLFVR